MSAAGGAARGAPPALVVLYEDAWLLAVDKPSGLLVHRGWGDDAVVATDLVRALTGAAAHPAHRLDRGTSGVLLFARDGATAAALGRCFEQGAVAKRYRALVRGALAGPVTVDHAIPRAEGGARVPAVTDVAPLAAVGRFGWVEARPRTGRLHQVRRHLKHLSHPVVGDANYGKGAINRAACAEYGLCRLALHACALAFAHPHTGAPVALWAPVPADLRDPLARLGFAPEVVDGPAA